MPTHIRPESNRKRRHQKECKADKLKSRIRGNQERIHNRGDDPKPLKPLSARPSRQPTHQAQHAISTRLVRVGIGLMKNDVPDAVSNHHLDLCVPSSACALPSSFSSVRFDVRASLFVALETLVQTAPEILQTSQSSAHPHALHPRRPQQPAMTMTPNITCFFIHTLLVTE